MEKTTTTCFPRVKSIFILIFTINFFLVSLPLSAQKKSRQKASGATTTNIILTDKETSRYRIVVPTAATPHELKASQVLQDYLLQISGVALPIVAANKGRSQYEIVLGQNERLAEAGINVDFNKLKEDGFLIKVDSLRLVNAGGNEKGIKKSAFFK